MLGTDDRKPDIGVEVLARHIGQPHRHIGQLRKPLGLVGIGDEARRIDDDLAAVEPGVKNIAEYFGRAGVPPFRRQHADADRTAEFPVNIDAEGPGIGQIVVAIGDACSGNSTTRAFAQIGAVAQPIDFFLFLGSFGEAIIDVIEQVRAASDGRGRKLRPRTSY